MLTIVPLYAAVLGLIYVALSIYVIRGRYANRVSLGTAGNDDMERRVRMHGNFAEYAPFALLLLAFAENRSAGEAWLHGLCALLVIARLSHLYAIRTDFFPCRAAGMIGTFAVFVGAAALILI